MSALRLAADRAGMDLSVRAYEAPAVHPAAGRHPAIAGFKPSPRTAASGAACASRLELDP